MSASICFMLHLQTNMLMDRGRVTWINFRPEKTVAVMDGGVWVLQPACASARFDVEV